MQRVMIVGCPGAGKTTVAKRLAVVTGLPLVHLDFHYWQSGWVRTESDVWAEKVETFAAQPRWIIDGNYGGTLEPRIARADTVIHLDFPTTSACIVCSVECWLDWERDERLSSLRAVKSALTGNFSGLSSTTNGQTGHVTLKS